MSRKSTSMTTTRSLYNQAYRALRVRGCVARECDQYAWARATRTLELLGQARPAIVGAAKVSYCDYLEYGVDQWEPLFPRFYSAIRREPQTLEEVYG